MNRSLEKVPNFQIYAPYPIVYDQERTQRARPAPSLPSAFGTTWTTKGTAERRMPSSIEGWTRRRTSQTIRLRNEGQIAQAERLLHPNENGRAQKKSCPSPNPSESLVEIGGTSKFLGGGQGAPSKEALSGAKKGAPRCA